MTKTPSLKKRPLGYIEAQVVSLTRKIHPQDLGEETSKLENILRQALTADRTALLTELRNSGLLEDEKDCENCNDCESMMSCPRKESHNALARAVKARLDELIKSTK